MSQDSIPECLDNNDYLLTYELGNNSLRTLIFGNADELRRFLKERGMDEDPASFIIRKQCVVDNEAFIAGCDDELEDYIRIRVRDA